MTSPLNGIKIMKPSEKWKENIKQQIKIENRRLSILTLDTNRSFIYYTNIIEDIVFDKDTVTIYEKNGNFTTLNLNLVISISVFKI